MARQEALRSCLNFSHAFHRYYFTSISSFSRITFLSFFLFSRYIYCQLYLQAKMASSIILLSSRVEWLRRQRAKLDHRTIICWLLLSLYLHLFWVRSRFKLNSFYEQKKLFYIFSSLSLPHIFYRVNKNVKLLINILMFLLLILSLYDLISPPSL